MKRLVLHSAFLIFPFIMHAQQLLLKDAVDIALKNSLDIEVIRNNINISTINNNIGIAGGLPTLNATGSENRQLTSINQQYTDPTRNAKRDNVGSTNITAGLTGSFLLFNGFRIKSAKHELESLQHLSEQQLNAEVQNLIAAVMVKYYDIVRQQDYIKTLDQSIAVFRQQLEIVQAQINVGVANNANLFQAQLDLNAELQAKQSQQVIIDQGITDLLRLLTLRTDSSVGIRDTIIVDRSLNLNTVLSRLPSHPEILAADFQVRANEWIEKEVAAQRYPSIRLNTGYNFTSNKSAAGFSLLNESYGPFVNVGVTVPIYNGGVYKRQQKIARFNTLNSGIQKDILLKDNESLAVKNWQSYSNTLGQLETEQQNNKLAYQLLDLVLKRFQLKQATIVEVKQAQQSFEASGYRLVNLSFAAKSAEIELKRLANQLAL